MTENRTGRATPVDVGGAGRPPRAGAVVAAGSLFLLALWAAYWVKSVHDDEMAFGHYTWVPALPFIAGDFKLNIDHVARARAAGLDPFSMKEDNFCYLSVYPPMVPRLFAWVSLFPKTATTPIWLSALSVVLGVGAYGAWRTRRALGLCRVPLAAVAAALFFSSPALYAMERGQCDPLVIPALMVVAWLLARRTTWSEVAAGGLLGAVAWLKYYPGLAVLAFPALGRWRGVAAFVLVAGLIGVVDRDGVRRSYENGIIVTRMVPRYYPTLALNHSVVAEWRSLGVRKYVPLLRKVPPPLAAVVLLVPAVALVCRRVSRAGDPVRLAFPLMLWLSAAATYGMPYANDYNLVVLPLAALAVWDRRDPPFVHAAMGLLLVWWQPFVLPVPGELLFYAKLAALYAVGVSLAVRAGESAHGDSGGDGRSIRSPVLERIPRVRTPSRGPWPAGLAGMLGL
ncbi:MAG: DUF2029 domain-containing protein, partial [Planctomycetia bacterium]|nr:DUF2029 domain-containing protein [Planctomycetia bacterium]